jgi:hypothetical protein
MNNGFFGFPANQNLGTILDIKEFDTSGTYIVPSGANRLWVMLIGAGCGGGGGRRSATNVAASGGGGGAGGTVNTAYYWVDSLSIAGEARGGGGAPAIRPGSYGKTLTIVLGAGGAGGAKATGDSADGSNGGRGGDSYIQVTGMTGNMMYSYGGANYGSPFGSGGTISTGSAGSVTGVSGYPMINGIASPMASTSFSSNGAGAGNSVTIYGLYSSNGGAGGGSISSGNVAGNAGGLSINTGLQPIVLNPNFNLNNGNILKAAGVANSGNPSFEALTVHGPYSPGLGGVGGGAGSAVAAGNGTNGYRGGGGGGGGASRNGLASGDGGAGGDGYCAIIALR